MGDRSPSPSPDDLFIMAAMFLIALVAFSIVLGAAAWTAVSL